jgi:flagellar motor switch protein FliM
MTGDVLTQEEVESLLSSLEVGPKPAAPRNVRATRLREKVTAYDFKRPERVGKEQMRSLQTLHEGFGRSFGAALSALLRNIVEVRLTSVDQLTYSEFVFSLENPTCFNLLRADPLDGHLILDINPAILYPIIDRLLGGGKEGSPIARRPLTEIELRLVSKITRLFLRELRTAWENVIELDLEVIRVESNPQLVQIVPPNEVVVLVSFEITLGEVRGMMNLCIPFNAIERFSTKLTANTWSSYGRQQATPETRRLIGEHVAGALVQLHVDLAETKISAGDLLGLRVGDIVTTDKDLREPLTVYVEGAARFRASPGVYKGRKAIRIEEVLPPAALASR